MSEEQADLVRYALSWMAGGGAGILGVGVFLDLPVIWILGLVISTGALLGRRVASDRMTDA